MEEKKFITKEFVLRHVYRIWNMLGMGIEDFVMVNQTVWSKIVHCQWNYMRLTRPGSSRVSAPGSRAATYQSRT